MIHFHDGCKRGVFSRCSESSWWIMVSYERAHLSPQGERLLDMSCTNENDLSPALFSDRRHFTHTGGRLGTRVSGVGSMRSRGAALLVICPCLERISSISTLRSSATWSMALAISFFVWACTATPSSSLDRCNENRSLQTAFSFVVAFFVAGCAHFSLGSPHVERK